MTKVIFIDAEYGGEILLSKEVFDYIKKNKIQSIALFASVQFLHFSGVVKQLSDLGINIVISKAKRTSRAGQILGCNVYEENFEKDLFENVDAVLYIGDGVFHPSALVFAGVKKLIIYNPISNKFRVLGEKDIEGNEKIMETNAKKFLVADSIGIFISVKPGQEHLNLVRELKIKLEKKGKKVYVFAGNEFNSLDLENFNFIKAWVNSACPRIGTDDLSGIRKAIVNIKDAFDLIV